MERAPAVISSTKAPAYGGSEGALRYGWTTGTCVAAAAKAACIALRRGGFPSEVEVRLPGGARRAKLTIHSGKSHRHWCEASVIKDAGDDPDVTHGAVIRARVWECHPGDNATASSLYEDAQRADYGDAAYPAIRFIAGTGIGTVTKEGLMLPVGEPAINPIPRQMIAYALGEVAGFAGAAGGRGGKHTPSSGAPPTILAVRVEIPRGRLMARRTWNARLGIVGGLSILGTTGIVVPYSCAAWIHSIHRGIDVARANQYHTVAACVGKTSDAMMARELRLDLTARIDMGDFVGGTLKYVRRNPVPRLIIAGGVGKITKLAQGASDLHSARSAVDYSRLAKWAAACGASKALASQVAGCTTVNHAMSVVRAAEGALAVSLGEDIARRAAICARRLLGESSPTRLEVWCCDRSARKLAAYRETTG